MKMVNMAMKPEKKEEGKSDCCCCAGPCGCDEGKPRYPWGLQLTLENDQLQALGISALPKVGETMTLQATVKVTGCNESEREGEEPARSISLQITDLGLEAPEAKAAMMDKAKVAAALYDKTEG
jgi:hypothetical protein